MRDFDEYERDPWAEELVRIYDEEQARETFYNFKVDENLYDLVSEPWMFECEQIIDDLGLGSSSYKIVLLPIDKLRILTKKYQAQNIDIDSYGQLVSRDPLPNYVPKTSNINKEFYTLGRILGLMGDLGRYYYLIPDINFSRGLWHGQVEKMIADNDLDSLTSVKEEMEFLKPGCSSAEFERIRNNIFSLKDDNYNFGDISVVSK